MKYAFGMQTDFLHVSVHMCVIVCAVRYTRDRVQSRAIERKEKEGGELMRKQGRIQPAPIDNLTPHFQANTYIGSIFEIPFENYGSALGLRNDFSEVISSRVSES